MKLAFRTKFFYGLGEIGNSLPKLMVSMLFLYFLTDVVGLEPALAGTVFMLGRVWDAANDPLMGLLSDRTRTKWGRRRPFFVIAAVPLGISFFLMWYPFSVDGQIAKTILYTVLHICFTTFSTCYFVPYSGLFPELSDDYAERTSISTFRQAFSFIFGTLGSVLVPILIMKVFKDNQSMGFILTMLPISVLIAIIPLVVFSQTKEQDSSLLPKEEKLNVLSELSILFKVRDFFFFCLIFVGCNAAVAFVESFAIYYMKYWLMREEQMWMLLLSVLSVALLSLPLWSFLTKKMGKKNMTILGLFLWAVPQLFWLLLQPDTSMVIVCLVGAAAGIGFGGANIFFWSIFPDVMDKVELETGKRREGVFSGFLFLLLKGSHSVSVFMIGLILQAVGYVANAPQTGMALEVMRLIYCFGPIFFIIVAMIGAYFYPITPEKYLEIRKELDARKASEPKLE